MKYIIHNKFHDTANPQGVLSDSKLCCILKSPRGFKDIHAQGPTPNILTSLLESRPWVVFKASPSYFNVQPGFRPPKDVKY